MNKTLITPKSGAHVTVGAAGEYVKLHRVTITHQLVNATDFIEVAALFLYLYKEGFEHATQQGYQDYLKDFYD